MDIYINEDNLVAWDAMADGTDSSFVNDATVTYNLTDTGGTSMATGSLAYVAASSGKYQGTIQKSDAANLAAGTQYVLEVIAASSGRDGFRRLPVVARYHQ